MSPMLDPNKKLKLMELLKDQRRVDPKKREAILARLDILNEHQVGELIKAIVDGKYGLKKNADEQKEKSPHTETNQSNRQSELKEGNLESVRKLGEKEQKIDEIEMEIAPRTIDNN